MIQGISINNFKCFRDAKIELRPLTVLTGLNGSGKSTMLQMLLLLRQSHLAERLNTDGLFLQGDLFHVGLTVDALNEAADKDEIEVSLKIKDTNVNWVFDASKELDYLPHKKIPANQDKNFETVLNSSLFSEGFHYLSAERQGPQITQAKDDYTVKKRRTVGIAGEFTGHFLDVNADMSIEKSRHHKNERVDTLKAQTAAWLGEISPHARLHTKDQPGTDEVSINFSYGTSDGTTNQYRATNVGFGLSYILPIIVTALIAKPGDLLLIDSPEVHLHPRGQSKIGELLAHVANDGVQVIIETHSDHITNGLRLAVHDGIIAPEDIQFHYLSRIPDGNNYETIIESPALDRDGRFDEWPKGFFDEWNVNLQRLLYPSQRENNDA